MYCKTIISVFIFHTAIFLGSYSGYCQESKSRMYDPSVLINGVTAKDLYINIGEFEKIDSLFLNNDTLQIKSFKLYCYKFDQMVRGDSSGFDSEDFANGNRITQRMRDMIYSDGKTWLVDFDWCKIYEVIATNRSGIIYKDQIPEIKMHFIRN